jgi:enterochelin esterase-like enzyme
MNISHRLLTLCTSACLLATLLVAQPAETKSTPAGRGKGKAAKEGERPRDQKPSWLMPPVQGANLHYKTFDSKLAGEKVSYLLYLPPGYESWGARRYPVVYWLHGIGGSQQGVPQMAERMTKAIEEKKAPPMIVVYVNGMIRSSYVDSADGRTPVESVSIKELIPHIDATYRTIATREGRMIEGFSMGGAGAAKWGFKFPDLFGSISIVDGALGTSAEPDARKMESLQSVYGGDVERYKASNPVVLAPKNADKVKGRTAIRIVTRTTGLAGANEKFSELLNQLGLEHEFYKIPDAPHSPNPLYEGLGERNWPFYAKAFKAALGGK